MFQAGAVIIAAGLSSRMGEFKPMLPLGDTTVIRKIIETFQSAGVQKIVVVTGYRASELRAHIADMGVVCVKNERYDRSQMFDSAKLGFSTLQGLCKKVFFMPVDIPLFGTDTLKKLMECGSDLVCPTCQNKKGHPILIADYLLKEIIPYRGDYGLHGAFNQCSRKMEYLPVDDWGILYDMDTQKDYTIVKTMYDELNLQKKREDC